jgi:hypothetical protein
VIYSETPRTMRPFLSRLFADEFYTTRSTSARYLRLSISFNEPVIYLGETCMKGAVEKDVARAASETSTCTTAAQIEF